MKREEIIEYGLSRGELLATVECGCVIIEDRTADAYIVFCPKHEAAPDMYEALRHTEIVLENLGILNQQQELLKLEVDKALAKAEGKC